PALLGAAFLGRLAAAALVPGFPVDIACFTVWADQMAAVGPARFYVTGLFSDYPPGYMVLLWPIGILGRWLGTGATELMVKMPSIVFDMGVIALLYRTAQPLGARRAAALALLYAANPLTLLAGAAWGQGDSVPSLLLMAAVLFIIRKQWRYALPIYVLAVLMKPQALMVGPLGLLAFAADLVRRKDSGKWKDALIGAGASAALALAIVLPFFNEQNGFSWLVGLYGNTMGYYNYASVNATNLFFLFGKNWSPVAGQAPLLLRAAGLLTLLAPAAFTLWRGAKATGKTLPLKDWLPPALCLLPAFAALAPLPMSATGALFMASAFLFTAWAFFKTGADALPLLAGVMLALFSILGTMMHERYLFLAVALLTLSYVRRRDGRVLVLLLALTFICFLNTGVVLDRGVRIGGGEGNLSSPDFGLVSDSGWLEFALSLLSLPAAAYGLYAMLARAQGKDAMAVPPLKAKSERRETQKNASFLRAGPGPLKTGRKDALLILLVTGLYAILAFVNLGSTVSPQTPWVGFPGDEPAVLDLGETRSFYLRYFPGIHWQDSGFTLETSDDMRSWEAASARVTYGDCFAWRTVSSAYSSPDGSLTYGGELALWGRYLRLAPSGAKLTLMEVVAQDAETGANIPLTVLEGDAAALADEQATLSGPPSWFNSMYFDEIYHARTAYEQANALRGLEPSAIYETSHPPLGKVFMTFSVMLFGMTPFGWRFAGAMAGVLMLPGMYLLGRLLTGKRRYGMLAMLLMALDFMHFTQTRIATIDSFVTLFIIYAYYFMFRYMAMDRQRTPLQRTLVPLALSGLMMGLGIASKWTGIYAGAGLAVLFFWTLIRDALDGARAARLDPAAIGADWPRRALWTLLACVGFFVAVPLAVYYASFIPVFVATPGGITVQKVVNANAGMFSYHSTPGLGADHFWSSPWYEWPLFLKPMWFYSGGQRGGTVSTIMSFGNPAVWLTGLAALLLTAYLAVRARIGRRELGVTPVPAASDPRPLMLLVSFAAQYLPWILVPRGTYIYHYFPAVPFIILCVALVIHYAEPRWPKTARALLYALPALALLFFVAFFPYLSGVRVPVAWAEALRVFPNWLYF
ncbi:MAG TPA: phospholipid carrier-dependent glycosyltransferase, partial [Candidatus Limnocylindria bacterium]|nr:phospholipid carrier-dependent glycosyltransferase [Candidatus Limnocylindria bacterium]